VNFEISDPPEVLKVVWANLSLGCTIVHCTTLRWIKYYFTLYLIWSIQNVKSSWPLYLRTCIYMRL